MVLKSMTRGTPSFNQLAKYILDEKKAMKSKDGTMYAFKHNLSGRTVEEIVQAFKENDVNRAKRKGGIALYHEVISWHADDAGKINTQSVEVIVRKYVELRNLNALYLGGIHEDKDSRHLHLMISSVEAVSGKSIRISKGRFEQIKKELQTFEQERFDLVQSQVEHGKHSMRKSDREYQLEKHTDKPSRKEEIKAILEKSFSESVSREDFYDKVREHFSMYERGGKVAGIEEEQRHFRFSTLGYGDEKIAELSIREERLEELHEIRCEGKGIEREVELKEVEEEKLADDLVDDIEQKELERT